MKKFIILFLLSYSYQNFLIGKESQENIIEAQETTAQASSNEEIFDNFDDDISDIEELPSGPKKPHTVNFAAVMAFLKIYFSSSFEKLKNYISKNNNKNDKKAIQKNERQ